jgi:hypothetical protein
MEVLFKYERLVYRYGSCGQLMRVKGHHCYTLAASARAEWRADIIMLVVVLLCLRKSRYRLICSAVHIATWRYGYSERIKCEKQAENLHRANICKFIGTSAIYLLIF